MASSLRRIVRKPWLAAIVLASLASSATVASGALSSGGDVTACAQKRSGALRMADRCTKDENPVSLSAGGKSLNGSWLARTYLVPGVGTPEENGTRLRRMLEGITASESRPAVLLIQPGVFDVGAGGIAMKPYVNLQGFGEGVTKVTAPASGPDHGTVDGADHAELRNLTVESSGGAAPAIAIRNQNAAPSLLGVSVVAGGSADATGIQNTGAPTVVRDVTVRVTGIAGGKGVGISNVAAPVRIDQSNITAGGARTDFGIANEGAAPVRIRASVIVAVAAGDQPSTGLRATDGSFVYVDGSRLVGDNAIDGKSNSQLRVGTSNVEGVVTFSPSASNSRCAFSYRADYTPLATNCQ